VKLLFDSFWRAVAYCLHPRVIVLSLLPLVVMAGLALGLGYFFWESAIDAVRASFESLEILRTMLGWLEGVGLSNLKTVLAPLIVVFLTTPVIVMLSLLLVAAFMTPAMLTLVASRRFPLLERKHGGSFLGSTLGAVWATAAALLAMVVSIPLWFVPPLVLIVPPLIWGWLTYRVMSYDVLAEHASADERREIIRRHRTALLGMGVLTGYLGAAPSLLWASGVLAIVFAPVLVPAAVWIYTLVFAFSALWYAHFALSALQSLRAERDPVEILPPLRGGPRDAELLEEARLIPPPPDEAAGAPPSSPWARP
jgi:hypothetical protein